jgi:hypothetical protein
MWTPRRILILTLAFVVFFTCYFGYAFTSIGRIDGLPPLPEEYQRIGGPSVAVPHSRRNCARRLGTTAPS